MTKNEEDFTSKKEARRKKIIDTNTYRDIEGYDPVEKRAQKNLNYKKNKEEKQEEEEWEEWDRYYNH